MIKAALKRYAIRVFMTILIIASVVAIVKTSWMHQVFQDIAAGMCLLGSWLCARALWPRKHDEDVTQPLPMPQVPEPVTKVDIWPDGDVVERVLIAQQHEMQQLLGEQQEGDEG